MLLRNDDNRGTGNKQSASSKSRNGNEVIA